MYFASRRRPHAVGSFRPRVETLERRDCPAVTALFAAGILAGSEQVDEDVLEVLAGDDRSALAATAALPHDWVLGTEMPQPSANTQLGPDTDGTALANHAAEPASAPQRRNLVTLHSLDLDLAAANSVNFGLWDQRTQRTRQVTLIADL